MWHQNEGCREVGTISQAPPKEDAGPARHGLLGAVPALGCASMAALAYADTCHLNNPRPCTSEDVRRLWTQAFAG